MPHFLFNLLHIFSGFIFLDFPLTPGYNNEDRLWIDLINDVTWRYNGASATYVNWGSGEPNSGGEDCTVMGAQQGEFRDVGCTRSYAFFCEFDI